MNEEFARTYPALSAWIMEEAGWIELGADEDSSSQVRILNEGGLIWESPTRCKTIDEALRAAERALVKWEEENG